MDTVSELRAVRARALAAGDINLAREAELQLDRYGMDYVTAAVPPRKTRATTKKA